MPDKDGPCAFAQLVVAQGLRAVQANFTLKDRSAGCWPHPEECGRLCGGRWARLHKDAVCCKAALLPPAGLKKHLASLHYYPCLAGQRSADVRMFQLP